MKKIFSILFLACIVLLQACSNNDDSTDPTPVSITVSDFSTSLDENPTTGTVIGTVSASASDGSTLTYTLSNENVSGALAINANTGEITVADVVAFDFESNPSLTANYKASNGTVEASGTITITLNNVVEGFKFTWETTSNGESMFLPVNAGWPSVDFDYTVDWGDGSASTNHVGNTTHNGHTYATPGAYQVTITGTFAAIQFGSNSTVANKVVSIDQWGDIEWKTMDGAFRRCRQMTYKATDRPNLSEVSSLNWMFSSTTMFNGDIGDWDVSNISSMNSMFREADAFNQNISGWDVSAVTNMGSMFQGSDAFNQALNDWNVSAVTNMNRMFITAQVFNQDLSSWDVSEVNDMSSMFENAFLFNQNLSGWSVANVTACSDFSVGSGLTSGNLPNFTNCTP